MLRDWRESDAPALEHVCGAQGVSRFTSVPWVYSEPAAREWVRRQHEKRRQGKALVLAVTQDREGRALGMVALSAVAETPTHATLGYWLVPAARGQGLALPATRAVTRWAFAELKLRRIELAIEPENAASHRVATRLGATKEGLRRESHEAEGRRWDMVIYSLLR